MRPPFTRTAGSLLRRQAPVASSSLLSRRAYASAAAAEVPAQVTTLPNKVRVATENIPGHFHSVGVYVDAGSSVQEHEQAHRRRDDRARRPARLADDVLVLARDDHVPVYRLPSVAAAGA
ncbi:hypothetical protein A1Q2_02893 [Trichosporon asahii var. asahii CBS 8904]|uniref:Uncharacterized protein n=1 Tax=Trichosporon asahii var. asahii (strain CBS 8904) TaxID=1220162 RepID=K1W1E1_TRIAC|nr:hypothetical protein A1Q2_02893 [Trichosporon asahii var. asahii CBS 8904]